MKLFSKKTNAWLVKNYQSGIALLLIAGFMAYIFSPIRPAIPQQIGVVENVWESRFSSRSGGRGGGRIVVTPTTVFRINGVEYFIRDRNDVYRTLLNKEVTFRYVTTTSAGRSAAKQLLEIVYDGELITPPLKDSNLVFIPAFVLFILGLFWCGWVLVLKWRK